MLTRYFHKKLVLLLAVLVVGLGSILLAHRQVLNFFAHARGFTSNVTTLTPAVYMSSHTSEQVLGASIAAQVGFMDARAYILDQYFKAANSPLLGTGQIFVNACNKYGAPADCTTVAAIARAETDLCKYHNSAEYFNCWGFGGGGSDRIKFGSWQESIDLVTNRLVNTYGLKYMIDPTLMEKVFCGSEPGCTNWGNRVKYYMQEISDYTKKLGFDYTLFDLR